MFNLLYTECTQIEGRKLKNECIFKLSGEARNFETC